MSGVWVFDKNGVMHLVENQNRKVLVHLPTDEVVTSYASLDRKLSILGWQRYYDNPNLIQYHKPSSIDLISLPKDFHKFNSIHMHDIVVKNSSAFEVRNV